MKYVITLIAGLFILLQAFYGASYLRERDDDALIRNIAKAYINKGTTR